MSGTVRTRMHRDACRYVRNAGDGATVANFDEDHEPIGPKLRHDLRKHIIQVGGRLVLNEDGVQLATQPD